MNLRNRLRRLEQAEQRCPAPAPLTDAERWKRAQWLIGYRGLDPDLIYRRDRLIELFRTAQRRKEEEGQ